MSRSSYRVLLAYTAVVAGMCVSAAGAAPAALPAAGDMARCAAVAAPDARLACYDDLAHRMAQQPAPVPPAPAMAAAARTPAASVGTVAAAAAPATPAPEMDPVRDFGLSYDRTHPAPKGPPSIQARVASIAENRIGGAQVVLDNGQVWIFTDNDGRVGVGDAITIKRGSLGSFIMTSPAHHTYHVHRIQ